jgi:hypothetical protein
MMQKLSLLFDAPFFNLEEAKSAAVEAEKTGGTVFTWKTTGVSNWLEKGISKVDALGLVVLPFCHPDKIDMPDDPAEEAEEVDDDEDLDDEEDPDDKVS